VTVDLAEAMATTQAMTKPDAAGTPVLPKRNGQKGLLPGTWVSRTVRISYVDASGSERDTQGLLLDWYPFGPVVSILGAKTLISWDRLVTCELVED
jgi:hypothetical protein